MTEAATDGISPVATHTTAPRRLREVAQAGGPGQSPPVSLTADLELEFQRCHQNHSQRAECRQERDLGRENPRSAQGTVGAAHGSAPERRETLRAAGKEGR